LLISAFKNDVYFKVKQLAVLLILFTFSWIVYNATKIVSYYYEILVKAIGGITEFSLFSERTSELLSDQFLNTPYYELIVRRFIYIPLIIMLTVLGIYILTSKKQHNIYTYTLISFVVIFMISLLGLLTSSFEFSRFQAFGFIGIAFFMGVTFEALQQRRYIKYISLVLIILLFVGGVSLGIESGSYKVHSSDTQRIGYQTVTVDLLSSAVWYKNHINENNLSVSDLSTNLIFNIYGNRNTNYMSYEIFYPSIIEPQLVSYLKRNKRDFLIVDKRITELTATLHYYFERRELYINNHPGYGNTKILPISSIKKFDDNIAFIKIYDNENIFIYKM